MDVVASAALVFPPEAPEFDPAATWTQLAPMVEKLAGLSSGPDGVRVHFLVQPTPEDLAQVGLLTGSTATLIEA